MPDSRLPHSSESDAARAVRVAIPHLNPVLIGQRIGELRRAHGLTGWHLARATGIPAGTIGAIETGRMLPGTARVVALAAVLGVSTDYVLIGRPMIPETTDGDGGGNGQRDE